MTGVKGQVSSEELHVAVLMGFLFGEISETFAAEDWAGLRQSHFRVISALPPDGLSVTGTDWEPGQWVGMRVVAGTSAGEILENTATSLKLSSDWIGGQPADTTPFVIVGPEAQLGAVSFGDGFTDTPGSGPKRGILRANSAQTFATVKPSFTADLTLVLDLQDPKTGSACVGFEGNTQPCPYTQTTGTFKTQVDSLPLGVDRVMVRTGVPLLKADFPIDTKVDLTANAGAQKSSSS